MAARSDIDPVELGEPGNISKLRSLFGDAKPVKRNFSINKKKSVVNDEVVEDGGGSVEDRKKEVAKEMIKDQVGGGSSKKKTIMFKQSSTVDDDGGLVENRKKQVAKEMVKDQLGVERVTDGVREEVVEKVVLERRVEVGEKRIKKEKRRKEKKEEIQEQVIDFAVEQAVESAVVEKVIKDKIEEEIEEKIEEHIKDEILDRVQGDDNDRKIKTSKKKVLIVYAHVFKESYEGCLVGAAVKALKEAGVEIQISNLYEMGFNPVASPLDFGGEVEDKEFYSYSLLAGLAKDKGRLAQDIVSEQDKVDWADLILIVSQLQSHGLPALLKGWFDRIMTYKFAFSDGNLYEKGRLRGKKALLCLTTEALSSMYTSRGIHGDINIYLWPLLNGVLRFAGFDVLKPLVYFGAGRASDEYRDTAIETLMNRLKSVWDEKPLSFIPTDRFTQANGFKLSDNDITELEKAKLLTVGQHAGKVVHTEMAFVVEPEKRVEKAMKGEKGDLKAGKKAWYTYW